MAGPLNFGAVSGISFSGIATGLDSASLINALVSLETAAIKTPLENKKTDLQAKLSALSTFDTKLKSLQSTVENIDTISEFLAYKTSSSDSSIFTATADGSALEGTHTVTISDLAQAETEQSNGYGDVDTETIGTGTLTVSYGGTANNITVDSSNNTLNGIASAINTADFGVTASVVNTAAEGQSASYSLILTGDDTGESNTITIDAIPSGGTADLLFTEKVTADNANFTIDGIGPIERESNTVSDVLTGVTFTLLNTGTNEQLTVSKDVDAAKAKITSFVNAYNDVQDFIDIHSKYEQDAETGALFGDLAIRIADFSLPSKILNVQDPSNGDYSNSAQAGITLTSEGKLEIDTDELTDALEDDINAVGILFSTGFDSNGGIAKQLDSFLDDFLSEADGIITQQESTINDNIDTINDDLVKADARLASLSNQLSKKFADLEAFSSQLQAQQAFLAQVPL